MANQEQLAILRQGVEVWNEWRAKNSGVEVDLASAQLRAANLKEADFNEADLMLADLKSADLRKAHLREAILIGADLSGADLSGADLFQAYLKSAKLSKAQLTDARLTGADLPVANFQGANLKGAHVLGADLTGANLDGANLERADLREAIFRETSLIRSKFLKTQVGMTIFGNSNLGSIIGLNDVVHTGPSSISTGTFAQSMGQISKTFLRGCGLSDWEIEGVKLYNPDLSNDERSKILYNMYDLQGSQAIQISPLFISYSHADSEFVDMIGNSLTKKGVRYWRDIHDMKSGRIEKQIDRAIRQNPTVLLVLSKHSLTSDWVEHEIRTARGLEKEIGRDALCPVALLRWMIAGSLVAGPSGSWNKSWNITSWIFLSGKMMESSIVCFVS